MQISGYLSVRGQKVEWSPKGSTESSGVMKMLYILVVVVSLVYTSVKSHQIMYFKWM